MRRALAAGLFSLLLAGSNFAIARADITPAAVHDTHTTVNESAVQSPDVAEWTSHLIVSGNRAHTAKSGQIRSFAGGVLARTSKIARALTKSALKFLGVPYVFGGTGRSGFDCSGYVQHVFGMLGISLPRTADAQFGAGHKIVGRIKPGDLVFFQTYAPGPSHVGIYLGRNKFVSASSSQGVSISSLKDPYWRSHYIGAKRLLASR